MELNALADLEGIGERILEIVQLSATSPMIFG
jgi:hypothetical protein